MKNYVGTSGWHYDHWRENFYPEDIPKSKWLEFYARCFSTVELNNSFYCLSSESDFKKWRDSTPKDFLFSLKVSRYITHLKRLKNISEAVANFAVRAKILGKKLGPFLYQLPESLKRDEQLLEDFIKILPKDNKHVFEFRNTSWFDEKIYLILRKHDCSFCIYDMPSFNTPIISTSDLVYVRFHGNRQLYGGHYSDEELFVWANNIAKIKSEFIFAYFNNDAQGHAIKNASTFINILKSLE